MERTLKQTLLGYLWPLLAFASVLAWLHFAAPAHAADKGGIPAPVNLEDRVSDLEAATQDATKGTWAGLYVGGYAGYGWGDLSGYGQQLDFKSLQGGATVGYNLQFGGIVTGIEGDVGILSVTSSDYPLGDQGLNADLTGRLGVLIFPKTLVYAKAGYAWYNSDKDYVPNLEGWTYGGGIEQFLSDHVSMKLEYMKLDLDAVDHIKPEDDTIKIGVAYHF